MSNTALATNSILQHYAEHAHGGNKPVAGGMDIPVLDFYSVSRTQLWEGLRRVVEGVAGGGQAESALMQNAFDNINYESSSLEFKQQNPELSGRKSVDNVLNALTALESLESFLQRKEYKKGDKKSLTPEEKDKINKVYEYLSAGARTINNTYSENEQNREIQIRKTGGTIFNKLHAMADTKGEIFGIIGKNNEKKRGDVNVLGNKDLIEKSLNESEIELWPGNVFMEETKHSFVYITGSDGDENRDRIILKAAAENAAKLLADKNPAEFINQIDIALIEASAISDGKFGQDLFRKMAQTTMDSKKEIIFAPPTNQDLIHLSSEKRDLLNEEEIIAKEQKIEENMKLFNEIIDHKNTTMLTMNESEAIQMFTNNGYNGKVSGKDDPELAQALAEVQARLKSKTEQAYEIEPVAIISVGTHGAYAITADKMVFMEGIKADLVVDTLGAGDAFAGAAIHARNELITQKIQENNDLKQINFTEQDLAKMLNYGQSTAKDVVQQKGAQLPNDNIKKLYEEIKNQIPTYENIGIDMVDKGMSSWVSSVSKPNAEVNYTLKT